jgi:cobalamin-dependent methionine synthase I
LSGCSEVVIFAATVGLDFDRLVGRYKRVSPSKALLIQALGAERVEALCDKFCAGFEGRTSRFSPGYGDLELQSQKEIFDLLRVEEKIGISLNESLLMTPTKSVTAIFGIKDEKTSVKDHDCSLCGLTECEFRR